VDVNLNTYSFRDVSLGTKERAVYDVCRSHLFRKLEEDKIECLKDETSDPSDNNSFDQGIGQAIRESRVEKARPENRPTLLDYELQSIGRSQSPWKC